MSEIPSPQIHAFTAVAQGRLREIITDSGVSVPFISNPDGGSKNPVILRVKALWDTGATGSVITEATAKSLNLQPISKVKVSHAGGESIQSVYLVNIYLPNNLIVQNVRVTECQDTTGKFGLIIGMDIITLGDFAITNVNGNTAVSFRIPSVETIDYVKEYNEKKIAKPYIAPKTPERNDPCPCGSGKKYKKCHGK